MKNKEQKEMQIQWTFIVIGSFFAVCLGIVVNSLYDLLKTVITPLMILIIFGCGSLFSFGLFSFLFTHLAEIKSMPNIKERTIFWMFLKSFFKRKNNQQRIE